MSINFWSFDVFVVCQLFFPIFSCLFYFFIGFILINQGTKINLPFCFKWSFDTNGKICSLRIWNQVGLWMIGIEWLNGWIVKRFDDRRILATLLGIRILLLIFISKLFWLLLFFSFCIFIQFFCNLSFFFISFILCSLFFFLFDIFIF